ncbi:uncharacterized protein [Watersipora subatra]|uniref:uncharacterized protein n=1 Tax=Watersipora subatra TaxID=2589382 RepID=UPI00355C38E5
MTMESLTRDLQSGCRQELKDLHEKVITSVRRGCAKSLKDLLQPVRQTNDCYVLLSRISKTGQFPLHYSIKEMVSEDGEKTDRLDIVRVIIDSLRREDRYRHFELQDKLHSHTALHAAAVNGEVEVIREILDSITSVEQQKLIDKRDKQGRTVLDCTNRREIKDLFKTFENRQVMPDDNSSDDGWTALNHDELVSYPEHSAHPEEMIPWLWGKDEGVGTQRFHPETINAETAFKYFDEMLEFVKAEDSYDVLIDELKNSDGKTILHLAVIHRQDALVKKLLKMLPKSESLQKLILMPCRKGKTALHYASLTNSLSVVNLLLEHCTGVRRWDLLSACCLEGKTALHYACQVDSLDIALSLLHHSGENDKELVCKSAKSLASKSAKTEMSMLLERVETHYWKAMYRRPTTHIFYNTFNNYSLPTKRQGAEEEKDQMVEAFRNFGQQPQVHCGFTEEKLRREIEKAVQAEGEQISGIVVVLMSHGKEYIVYDENCREIRLQNILNILCHDLLIGKPKVLVLQSCLTDRDQQVSTSHNTATNFDVKEASITLGVGSRSCDSYRFPCGDCCLITSTSRGKTSARGFLAGTLARITRGKSSDTQDETSDIRNIFLEANRKMNKRQIPEIHHNLSKILLLQPPHQRFSMRQKVVNFFRSK